MYTMTFEIDLPSIDTGPKPVQVIYTYDKLRKYEIASSAVGVQTVKISNRDITDQLTLEEIDLLRDMIQDRHVLNPDEFTYY